jgi:ubiquinol-cytochrome c reductase cytochrome b subunit
LCALFIQAITGVALALYYVPAAGTAHETVAYLTKQVWSGSFIRGVHAYGSHFIVLLLFAHVIQTFFYGAFKKRREILWLSGVCLFLLMLGMAFTGYLLPWDQRSYFATMVGTNVMAEVPVVGPLLKRLLRGGEEMGTLTLSRFYTLHILVLPGLILTLIALHVCLFRRAGPAGTPEMDLKEPRRPAQPFYPRQLLMDAAFALVLVLALAGVAHFLPVTLGPAANPASTEYIPRPEWYFLPMFQWLKYWQGPRAVIGIVIVPSLVILLFAGVPFLDRRYERRARKRLLSVVGFVLPLAVLAVLGALSYRDDRLDPRVRLQLAHQKDQEERYMKQPFVPALEAPSFANPVSTSPEIAAGRGVFLAHHCNFCHGDDAAGTAAAPRLVGIGEQLSTEQLMGLIRKPSAKMTAGKMPVFVGSDADLHAVVTYLLSLR